MSISEVPSSMPQRSQEPRQLDLWGGDAPVASGTATAPTEPREVLRRPGWYLIATRTSGPVCWHVLVTGSRGTVITGCGLTGRTVSEASRLITLCPVCETYVAGSFGEGEMM